MVVSIAFKKLRERTGWWKLMTLSVVTIIALMFLSPYSNINLQPVADIIPNANLRFFSQELNQSEQFESTDEEVKEVETKVENPKNFRKSIHLMRELNEAERLYKEVRLLCWVLMYPGGHNTSAKHIKATWGKRCNKLVFMSTQDDPSIGAIDVGSREGYHSLWNKTRCSLRYIYNNFLDDYDWFVKADSNTYVVVENVRYVMQAYDTNDPMYFGQHYKIYGHYNTGGAGYVMGREAVRRFVEVALPNHTLCVPDRPKGEDVWLGYCLGRIGIQLGDTRDHLGQGRFWQRHPITVMNKPKIPNQNYPIIKGERPDAMFSDTLVSFHELSVSDLYLLDYLIYKVRAFGHIPTLPLRVKLPPDNSVIPEKTREKYRQYEEETTQSFEESVRLGEPLK